MRDVRHAVGPSTVDHQPGHRVDEGAFDTVPQARQSRCLGFLLRRRQFCGHGEPHGVGHAFRARPQLLLLPAAELQCRQAYAFADEQDPGALQFPCDGAGSPVDSVAGLIALDVDQDAGTGLSSFLDGNSPYSSVLGAEFCVDFFRYNNAAGGVEIYEAVDGEFLLAGRLPVTFTTYDLSFAIPLTLLGDDGRVNIAAVFGPSSPEVLNLGPTDTVPNGGFLSSAGGSAAAGQSFALPRGGTARASEGLVPIHRLGGWKRLLGKP